jgi:hypothetical protein
MAPGRTALTRRIASAGSTPVADHVEIGVEVTRPMPSVETGALLARAERDAEDAAALAHR